MRCRTSWRSGGVALIASLALIVLAAPACAEDFTIQAASSPEPVLRGATVTHTFTITSNIPPGCVDPYSCGSPEHFELVLSRATPIKSTPSVNRFLSVTSSYGSCTVGVDAGYPSATCDLGTKGGIPPTVQVVATIQANESMQDAAIISTVTAPVSTFTHVIYPPVVSGSAKIQIKGLPTTCAAGDLTVKAHVTGAHVARIVAYLYGSTNEWGDHEDAGGATNQIALTHGTSLTAKVPGAKLKTKLDYTSFGYKFYTLFFTATIKGHASLKIKRSVRFQLC